MDEGDFEVRFRKFALLEFLWVDWSKLSKWTFETRCRKNEMYGGVSMGGTGMSYGIKSRGQIIILIPAWFKEPCFSFSLYLPPLALLCQLQDRRLLLETKCSCYNVTLSMDQENVSLDFGLASKCSQKNKFNWKTKWIIWPNKQTVALVTPIRYLRVDWT